MMTTPHIARFCEFVEARVGLHFEEAKYGFIADVLERRLGIRRWSADEYLNCLETGGHAEEFASIVEALTVSETYFFRNNDQFRALVENVIPEVIRHGAPRRLQILSAGCASGEEAYSIAMLLRDFVLQPFWDVSVIAVDINNQMLEKASRGRFSAWALRETPQAMQRRWLPQHGSDFVLDESIRRAVRFEPRNLAQNDAELWQPSKYDVIFCRNVLMYFSTESARTLIARITRSLTPGGYLFLGHAETLRGLSNDFQPCHTHETFYYRRKEHIEQSGDSSRREPDSNSPSADSWIDTIRSAGERITALTAVPAVVYKDSVPAASIAKPVWNLKTALELLSKERFSEALGVLDRLPPESRRDADVLLLRAVLLTDSGQLGQAQGCCLTLLEVDKTNAGARYLLALGYEKAADYKRAIEQDQIAVHLDPGFSMPRLHLGLMARRQAQLKSARRQLGDALTLLHQEDMSRLLLFGGGFSRSALIGLCRNELLACGGAG